MIEFSKLNLNECCGGDGVLKYYIYNPLAPLILIVPGGGYSHLSQRESEPVAEKFLSLSYNVAILMYSVFPYCYPIQLNEINHAISFLKEKCKHIILCGFSAGGHLVGMASTSMFASYIDASIFCYPVISFEKYVHEGTRECFIGHVPSQYEKHLFSIDNRVSKKTPPCFVWTTREDQSVPYQNSICLIDTLKKNSIKCFFKLFPKGQHGLALADETAVKDGDKSYIIRDVQKWPLLADKFIKEVLNEKE